LGFFGGEGRTEAIAADIDSLLFPEQVMPDMEGGSKRGPRVSSRRLRKNAVIPSRTLECMHQQRIPRHTACQTNVAARTGKANHIFLERFLYAGGNIGAFGRFQF